MIFLFSNKKPQKCEFVQIVPKKFELNLSNLNFGLNGWIGSSVAKGLLHVLHNAVRKI
jgi:hypothetical protein